MSEFDDYQFETRRTASPNPDRHMRLATLTLGLGGEAGEVQELIKKWLGHGKPFELETLKHELGDVLFYLARLADEHGIALQDVADANVTKLRARYPERLCAWRREPMKRRNLQKDLATFAPKWIEAAAYLIDENKRPFGESDGGVGAVMEALGVETSTEESDDAGNWEAYEDECDEQYDYTNRILEAMPGFLKKQLRKAAKR